MPQATLQNSNWLKWITFGLVVCLCIKILGYFTWSENINITRVLKIGMRLFSTALLGFIYLRVIKKGFVPSFTYKNLSPIMLYGLYLWMGLMSLLWTSNVFYSTLQLAMTTESILFLWWFFAIIEMLSSTMPEYKMKISSILAWSITPVLVLFIVGMYINPDQFFRLTHGGEVARLGGFMMNPNELGMLASVGVAAALVDLKFKGSKWYLWLIIGILVYGLLLTSSRSSLGGLVLVLALFILTSSHLWLKVISVVAGVILAPIVFNEIILKEGDWEEVLSMTGRLPFWKALISEGLVERPWLGYGFMRIAESDYFESVHTYAARMTHNTFVQVLLNLGILGFAITTFQMIATVATYIKTRSAYMKVFFIAIFIPIFINSLTEFGIFGENNFGILFYQFLIIAPIIHYSAKMSDKAQLYRLRLQY